jgi:predicted  nucleic acid-binding Zn-ribbon protein
MPIIKVHPSGGVVFSLTPEEQEAKNKRELLDKELEEVADLKAELKGLIESLKNN